MNMSKLVKAFIFSFSIFCFLFSGIYFVFAQGGIKISPIRIEEIIKPGDIIQKSVKVTNLSSYKTTLYPYRKDFKAAGEAGYPELLSPGSDIHGCGSWIKISEEGIPFEPGEEREVVFTIEVPQDIGPGGYYGALMFGTVPPEARLKGKGEERGAAITVGQQTGSLILLKVFGKTVEEAMVREFSTDKDVYSIPFKINFITRIENLGNVHIKPQGSIEIRNMLNRKVGVVKFNEAGANILPNSIRRFETNWEGNIGFGKYTALITLSFGTFTSEGGQGRQTIYAQTSFWIIPWKIIIPSVLALIFTGSLFLLFLRVYKNKAVEKVLREAGLMRARYIRKYEGPSPTLHLVLIIILVLVIFAIIAGTIFFLFFA